MPLSIVYNVAEWSERNITETELNTDLSMDSCQFISLAVMKPAKVIKMRNF